LDEDLISYMDDESQMKKMKSKLLKKYLIW